MPLTRFYTPSFRSIFLSRAQYYFWRRRADETALSQFHYFRLRQARGLLEAILLVSWIVISTFQLISRSFSASATGYTLSPASGIPSFAPAWISAPLPRTINGIGRSFHFNAFSFSQAITPHRPWPGMMPHHRSLMLKTLSDISARISDEFSIFHAAVFDHRT